MVTVELVQLSFYVCISVDLSAPITHERALAHFHLVCLNTNMELVHKKSQDNFYKHFNWKQSWISLCRLNIAG